MRISRLPVSVLLLAVTSFVLSPTGSAAELKADPSNYRSLLRKLQPGDTLKLAAGRYTHLPVFNVNGEPDAWITIAGPESGAPAEIVAGNDSNTVEIYNSSYVALENLRINSRGIPGAFGIAAHGRAGGRTHDIRIENNTLVGQNGGQQTVGISTKTPTWGWIIRANQILGAGTGIYLGHSDGGQPFVAGLIENNLIKDTIGYNLQIKEQNSIPITEGMPAASTITTIRNNVFIKNDQPSPDGDRPNVLLGGFPPTGTGALSMYEVYGNYFVHNHREALLQASGRVSVHDNVFVDGPFRYPAVVFRSHQNSPLKVAMFYNNTVYTIGQGVYFGDRAQRYDAVVGNILLAGTPVGGPVMRQSENLTDFSANAPKYLVSPSMLPGEANLYPLPGKCTGLPIDLSDFRMDTDYGVDFNGTPKAAAKGAVVFRGAYAGEGENPGWRLEAALKPMRAEASGPVAVSVSPATARRGTTAAVTVTGADFEEGSAVHVNGGGVKVASVKVESRTRILATLVIPPGAVAGPVEVVVSSAEGKSNAVRFSVAPGIRRAGGVK